MYFTAVLMIVLSFICNCIGGWNMKNLNLLEKRVYISLYSVQLSSVAQPCLIFWNPIDCSTPGLPVHHQLSEFTQTHVHRVGDAIQPSHPLSPPSPPAPNPSQHQGLFKWVSSSHEVAKVLVVTVYYKVYNVWEVKHMRTMVQKMGGKKGKNSVTRLT